ncbi:MAG: radical SAM protein [Nitrospirota bacterium]
MIHSDNNNYFVFLPHTQFVRGVHGSVVHDLFDGKLYWFNRQEISEALALLAKGRSIEEAAERSHLRYDELRQYIDALISLHVGRYAPYPFATEGYRPWALDAQIKKEGFNFQGGSVTIELARECLYDCEWCASKGALAAEPCGCFVSPKTDTEISMLPMERIVRSVELLRSLGFDRLVIAGGEPFREADRLWQLLELAARLGMKSELHTTGVIDCEMIERLCSFDVRIAMPFAASNTRAFNRAVRHPSGYNSLLNAVSRFASRGVAFTAKIPARIGREEAAIATADFAVSHGAVGIKFLVYGLPGKHTPEHIRNVVAPQGPADMAVDLRQFMINSQRHHCFYNALFIGADGAVKPCPGWKIAVASLAEESLATILGQGFFDRFAATARNDITSCSACEFRLGCRACLVRTIEWKGSLDAHHWLCSYEPGAGVWRK